MEVGAFVWDSSYMADDLIQTEKTPLQLALARALEAAPQARDHYDREIQRRTGTKGKPIYDIERGKSRRPGADTLDLIAEVLGLAPGALRTGTGLVDHLPSTATPFNMEGASERRMSHDVPIYWTALGAEVVPEGEAIEQTMLNTGEIVGYLRRPVLLDGRADVYGIYVQGSSMHPRYDDGGTVFVERRKPPRIGDDVVVYLRSPDHESGERVTSVLIKTLVRKSASYVELMQYEPKLTFRVEAARVERMDRVIPWGELVA